MLMSGIDRQFLKSAPDDMDVDTLLSDLNLDGFPYRDEMSLIKNDRSLRMTVPNDAWENAGRELDNPGEVDLFWFKDDDILIVDLSNE
jgi:hypothetical protein